MRASTLWSHRVLRATVTTVAAVALIAVGVSAAATSGTSARGPGYPPPKGVYAGYTNCPLNNPLMHEVMANGVGSDGGGLAACILGQATGGSITIGKITTPVTSPVTVQFGIYVPPEGAGCPAGTAGTCPGTFFPTPVVPPLSGTDAILSTGPDLIPGTLTSILGCPSSNPVVQNICTQAAANPADNQVYAQAEESGNLQQFNLFNWTQPVKFVLENPLLGSSCSIGTDAFPVFLHPNLSVGPGGGLTVVNDPAGNPYVEQLVINGAIASDTTFTAPGVTGCGPGGVNNVFVDEALDAGAGLPAATGNSLTLNGSFALAAGFHSENSTAPQVPDDAAELLASFKASTSNYKSIKHTITMAQAKAMFHIH
jgi:hypothetical protein